MPLDLALNGFRRADGAGRNPWPLPAGSSMANWARSRARTGVRNSLWQIRSASITVLAPVAVVMVCGLVRRRCFQASAVRSCRHRAVPAGPARCHGRSCVRRVLRRCSRSPRGWGIRHYRRSLCGAAMAGQQRVSSALCDQRRSRALAAKCCRRLLVEHHVAPRDDGERDGIRLVCSVLAGERLPFAGLVTLAAGSGGLGAGGSGILGL
jgi:hypothetical protein